MIWLDPMMQKKPEPEPVKPETCGIVSLDERIQKGAEALFASGQGWFEPGIYQGNVQFEVSDMSSSNGQIIPSDMKYPWDYGDEYGDITFKLKASNFCGFEDGGGTTPFIVSVGLNSNNKARMYLHNLAFPEFVGTRIMAELVATVVAIDVDNLYGSWGVPFIICDIVQPDGSFWSSVVQSAGTVEGDLFATMGADLLAKTDSAGLRYDGVHQGFVEGHVGYIG